MELHKISRGLTCSHRYTKRAVVTERGSNGTSIHNFKRQNYFTTLPGKYQYFSCSLHLIQNHHLMHVSLCQRLWLSQPMMHSIESRSFIYAVVWQYSVAGSDTFSIRRFRKFRVAASSLRVASFASRALRIEMRYMMNSLFPKKILWATLHKKASYYYRHVLHGTIKARQSYSSWALFRARNAKHCITEGSYFSFKCLWLIWLKTS